MNAKKRFLAQRDAYKKNDFVTVKKLAKEARQELLDQGLVQRLPIFKWIEKAWFDRAVEMGAVVEKTSPETGLKMKDHWVPFVKEIIIEKYVKGKTIKVKKINSTNWENWTRLYSIYERQKLANDSNWEGIMESEQKQSTFIA